MSSSLLPSSLFIKFHTEDFALMEASYAVIRVLQAYPGIRLAPESRNEPIGAEKQTYTIGLSPTEGVHVALA